MNIRNSTDSDEF